MPLWTVLLVALGVSADAFAIALSLGLRMRRFSLRTASDIAVTFGLFQAGMPLLGYVVGSQLARYIVEIDHWVAFALLALVAARMLHEAFLDDDDDVDRAGRVLTWRRLLLLAVATSIDALAVGMSFAFLDIDILGAAVLIGLTTLALSFGGVVVGHRAGVRWRRPAEVTGAVVLLLIGFRILFDHLGVL